MFYSLIEDFFRLKLCIRNDARSLIFRGFESLKQKYGTCSFNYKCFSRHLLLPSHTSLHKWSPEITIRILFSTPRIR